MYYKVVGKIGTISNIQMNQKPLRKLKSGKISMTNLTYTNKGIKMNHEEYFEDYTIEFEHWREDIYLPDQLDGIKPFIKNAQVELQLKTFKCYDFISKFDLAEPNNSFSNLAYQWCNLFGIREIDRFIGLKLFCVVYYTIKHHQAISKKENKDEN